NKPKEVTVPTPPEVTEIPVVATPPVSEISKEEMVPAREPDSSTWDNGNQGDKIVSFVALGVAFAVMLTLMIQQIFTDKTILASLIGILLATLISSVGGYTFRWVLRGNPLGFLQLFGAVA
ncbi:hypothetical protein JT71_14565, partial [Listeria monocytogenes]